MRSFPDIVEDYERIFDDVVDSEDCRASKEFVLGQTAVILDRGPYQLGIRRTMFLAGQGMVPGLTLPVSGSIYLAHEDGSMDTCIRYVSTWPQEVAKALFGVKEASISRELPKRTIHSLAEKQAFYLAGKFLELSVAKVA